MGNSVVTKTSSVAVVGNLSTKNIDVSATVTSVKVDPGRIGEGMRPISDKPSITGCILFGIKNYFGKNITTIDIDELQPSEFRIFKIKRTR